MRDSKRRQGKKKKEQHKGPFLPHISSQLWPNIIFREAAAKRLTTLVSCWFGFSKGSSAQGCDKYSALLKWPRMRPLLSYSHCKNFPGLQVPVFPLQAQAQKRRQAAGKALSQSLPPDRRKEVINRPKATCSKVCIQVMLPSLCPTCLGRTAEEVYPSPTCWQVHICTGPKL